MLLEALDGGNQVVKVSWKPNIKRSIVDEQRNVILNQAKDSCVDPDTFRIDDRSVRTVRDSVETGEPPIWDRPCYLIREWPLSKLVAKLYPYSTSLPVLGSRWGNAVRVQLHG